MKITISEIDLLYRAVQSLQQEKIQIPPMTMYDIVRTGKLVQDEFEAYEAVRTKAIEKFGEADTKSGGTFIPQKNVDAFQKELQPILDKKVEVDLPKINLSAIASLKILGDVVAGLFPILIDDRANIPPQEAAKPAPKLV